MLFARVAHEACGQSVHLVAAQMGISRKSVYRLLSAKISNDARQHAVKIAHEIQLAFNVKK